MTGSFRPRALREVSAQPSDPAEVVEAFLGALVAGDLAAAAGLLDEHVAYANVGLPTIRGRRRALRVLALFARPAVSLEVYLHSVAVNGSTVLTERTDAIVVGPFRLQIWVIGHFEVRDGRITFWRDAFDYLDAMRASVRAVAGAVVPALRPSAPGSPDVAPGRH